MKAILNVSKFNQYSKFNFRTFDVVEVLSTGFCLNINGVKTDFSHTEVILVDIQSIINEHVLFVDRTSPHDKYLLKLKIEMYLRTNKIKTKL